jgi:hypothetical protein
MVQEILDPLTLIPDPKGGAVEKGGAGESEIVGA